MTAVVAAGIGRPMSADADPVAPHIEAWAARQAKAAPRLGEGQLETLRELFQ
ncbi:hypothetical protein QFZ67_004489 [Streptomyces sp. V1I1]|nr:hypothetical protein [Streptomyces sp. V1I1]